MKTIHLTFQHPKEKWNDFLGEKLDEDSYDTLIEEDADVYTPEGEILFKYRKKALDPAAAQAAFPILLGIKAKTLNRGISTGKLFIEHSKFETKDGSKTKTAHVPTDLAPMSNIIGFYDRYVRTPYCRQTAFNINEPLKWEKILPFIQSCAKVYQEAAPERYALQKEVCDKTHPDWIIKGTPYTTITVNQNWSTAVHTDTGDLKAGLSCITALRGGSYKGANLVFPHYRAAVNLDTCDLLMFNSHHLHGNTPLIGKVGQYKRVSLVLYFREKIKDCLSAQEELERAKSRKPGMPLWD